MFNLQLTSTNLLFKRIEKLLSRAWEDESLEQTKTRDSQTELTEEG